MKKRILLLYFYYWGIASLSIASAALSHEDFAGYPGEDRPELRARHRVEFLDQQLALSPRQKLDIETIYTEENVAITNGDPAPSKETLLKLAFAANDRIRPLLTPEQRGKFNLIPIGSGGGLVGRSPWEQLDRLDKLVKLSAAQKKDALNVYLVGTEGLMENQSPDNAAAANKIKAAMAADIRSILTPEQRKLWDDEPVKRGGGKPPYSAEHQVARLDEVVHFSPAERAEALRIFQEAIAALMTNPPRERSLLIPKYRKAAELKIRAILTPAQQKALDDALAKRDASSPMATGS